MSRKKRKKKKEKPVLPRVGERQYVLVTDVILAVTVFLPLLLLILSLCGVPVGRFAFGMICAAAYLLSGIAVLLLTALGACGFGAEGRYPTLTSVGSFRTAEEAQKRSYLLAAVLSALGVLFLLLTLLL